MSNPDQAISEAQEMIDSYGLEAFAKVLGLTDRAIQYWYADEKPKKPGPKTRNKIHELFALHKSGKWPVTAQAAQNGEIAGNWVKEDYLSGKNLENFSEAHRQLATAIARAQSGTHPAQVLAPRLIGLIREGFSGKKQMSIDQLLKLIDKALTTDNNYK